MSLLAKVCGLARASDADSAAVLGADLLGFVIHPPSPRHCPNLAIAESHLDRAVLVMVAKQGEDILERARRFGFQRVQPHLPPEARPRGIALLKEAGLFVLLPWADEPGQEDLSADLYLWEPSPSQTGMTGGSGQTHAMAFPPPGPFLLAGGLEAGTLQTRVALLSPTLRASLRGFDAASRLEAAPGLKDPGRVEAFLHVAHTLELS